MRLLVALAIASLVVLLTSSRAAAGVDWKALFDSLPQETPIADLWIDERGNIGTRLGVLVVVAGGVDPGPDLDTRCRESARQAPAKTSVVCLDDPRLWREVNGE